MKLRSVKLKNFRSYKEETIIDLDDLTVFVGKNDIGKSTILEALDIFFNDGKGAIKLDKDDVNKTAIAEGDNDIYISAIFTDLPTNVVIDSTNETTFDNEYLLNSDGYLEVIKKYPNAGASKVFIKANHPTNPDCADLLLKKIVDYKKIITKENIECENLTINAIMRTAIWSHFAGDLQLEEILIDTSKEDAKNIWEKIQTYLPQYSLFQSDRKNSDNDSEVQDPLKKAVQQILADQEIVAMFEDIAQRVASRLTEVSDLTLDKLREMNPEIANTLNPIIPASNALKWSDVFKSVSICGDENIPINKRGSGVKRLILLNFFRAEAERRLQSGNSQSIIYAIEEPETSQHSDHQKLLIKAFIELSQANNTQVLLTTHSSTVVKGLDFDHLRLVSKNDAGNKSIEAIIPNQLPYPSLNEINFIAFKDLTEEYHNELHGFIEGEEMWANFKNGRPTMNYTKIFKDGNTGLQQVVLTEYIRHQIHHPENALNQRYTFDQLVDSVNNMREFILSQRN
ncbi:ATP/GTP-binding protein [Pedobacter lusitanus]|uniref:ATP/GTP-binding protein n=1 Tax=Pedobacter lusitanus TaxID=1503925 RepID=A0A0D0GES7_9SPHI|nr:ATP-binding protein [Pedobacter lusitanus]KIO74685.1 ATP/GTP-binding protein [Pedobacter lusitanus]